MFTNNPQRFQKGPSPLVFYGAGIALLIGLTLAILSWVEFCVEHCSANQDYRLFGLPFSLVGIPFFIVLLSTHLLSRWYPALTKWVGRMIAMALGAEMMFLIVQHYWIGRWCPLCLGVLSTLIITALFYSIDKIKTLISNQGTIMKKIGTTFSSLPFFIFGFLLAFLGITKFDAIQAAEDDIKNKITFGTLKSPIEVYFASDWFCPSCKKLEFMIEKLLPEVKSDVAFYFIDYPVHQKSLNFSPYNLSFMINNKENYFQARHFLFALTEDTDAPKDCQVEKAAKDENLTFTPLSYVEIKAGLDFFDKTVKEFGMGYTPTVIIRNTKTKKVIKLEGTDEITEAKILKAIETLKKK